MRNWLKRARAAAGIGFTWAFVWSAAGMVPRWLLGIDTDAPLPLVVGVFGFLAGTTFAALLALTQRRRRFEQLSLGRVSGWGALGGALLATVFTRTAALGWGDLLAIAPTFALASGVCAAGSLAVARRGLRETPAAHAELGGENAAVSPRRLSANRD